MTNLIIIGLIILVVLVVFMILANPLFPASGLATGSFNGLHTKSKFLAVTRDTPRGSAEVSTTHRHHFGPPSAAVCNRRHPMSCTRMLPPMRIARIIIIVLWMAARWAAAVEPGTASPGEKPWSQNRGERLSNGIVLPEEWPPRDIDQTDTAPMPVPYLESRPEVVPIDVGRQLFVDNFLIETSELKRVYHLPEKYLGNPILKPETELEQGPAKNDIAAAKGGLWWDPAENIFKMWYDAAFVNTICYATSKDGLRWGRPSLDIVPGTNQAFPRDLVPDTWSVVLDWATRDPQQRYKMFVTKLDTGKGVGMTSSDGIHWINRATTGPLGDCSTMFYNPFRKKWVYSLRSYFGNRGRSRHYWECDDFPAGAKWEPGEPVAWAAADRDDPKDRLISAVPQLYCLNAVAYESIMLGSFDIWRGPENNVCHAMGLPKIVEPSLAYSRDGFHWYRPDRRAYISCERRDVWDRGYVRSLSNLCTVRGDKLWFYYSAIQGDIDRTYWPEKPNAHYESGMYRRGSTGVAFLRRDGFASMDAGATAGTLTTRPIRFTGSHLFVNVDALQGELLVEILDEDSRPISPFTLENCQPVQADSTLEPVTWTTGDLGRLRGRPVRIRFTLRNGSLYAFWVSGDMSGRSDGYVAGGGPGFTGPTDTVGRAAIEAEMKIGVQMR